MTPSRWPDLRWIRCAASYGERVTRCDSFFLYEGVAYRCELSPHKDGALDHMAVTKKRLRGFRVVEQWGLLVWTTAMADEGFDR